MTDFKLINQKIRRYSHKYLVNEENNTKIQKNPQTCTSLQSTTFYFRDK